MKDETTSAGAVAPSEESLKSRLLDACDLTLAMSVLADVASRLRKGSENHREIEKSERTMYRLYQGLIRNRAVASLEPDLCEAVETALSRARTAYRDEIQKLLDAKAKR